MYQKPSETGWFYHAPPRPAVGPEIGVPPPSQIPGLAGEFIAAPPEPIPRTRIMETDSKYVRLAKRGGREDLLQFKHLGKPSEQPQTYPRVDWFYLEDIRAEEEEKYNNDKKEAHTFLLPDYMVHEAYRPDGNSDGDERFQPKRAPYNYDTTTAFEKDSRPTDKTIHLPEMKRDGYGVRLEKLKDKPIRHNVPVPQRGKPPPAEMSPEKKYDQCLLAEDERPVMSKILSFGYAKDWKDVRDKWQDKQNPKEVSGKGATFYGPPDKDKPRSEYQTQINDKAPRSGQNRSRTSRRNSNTSEKSLKERENQKEKELFKMARFKNVPAKIDSHSQRPSENALQAH